MTMPALYVQPDNISLPKNMSCQYVEEPVLKLMIPTITMPIWGKPLGIISITEVFYDL